MLVIRFTRIGKKNQPMYRIIVTDKRRATRGGRFVEILGNYNPFSKKTNIKKERVIYWISKGAKPSVSINNLLVKEKVIEGKKIATHAKKKGGEIPATTPVTPAPTTTPISTEATVTSEVPATPEASAPAPIEPLTPTPPAAPV